MFIFFAIPGILLPLLWYTFVTDRPESSKFTNQAEVDLIDEKASGTESVVSTKDEYKKIAVLDSLIRVKEIRLLDTTKSICLSWNVWGCSLGYCFQLGISSLLLA